MDYRNWLEDEFKARKKKNPRYSLRSFARHLDTDPSTVSQIIKGKRKISEKLVDRFCQCLGTHPRQKQSLIDFVKNQKVFGSGSEESYVQLSTDAINVISKWYHYVILELTYTAKITSYEQIADAVGITGDEAKAAVERLVRLDLLRIDGFQFYKSQKLLTLKSDKLASNFSDKKSPEQALVELQKHVLKKALRALDEVPTEQRDITSMTMAIDVDKLPAAKEMIKKFRRDMCAFLESGDSSQVYNMGISLYPVSKNMKQLSSQNVNQSLDQNIGQNKTLDH